MVCSLDDYIFLLVQRVCIVVEKYPYQSKETVSFVYRKCGKITKMITMNIFWGLAARPTWNPAAFPHWVLRTTVSLVLVLYSFDKGRNWGSQRLWDLPNVTARRGWSKNRPMFVSLQYLPPEHFPNFIPSCIKHHNCCHTQDHFFYSHIQTHFALSLTNSQWSRLRTVAELSSILSPP